MGKYYVIWEGRATGVFSSWDDAKEFVENYPGARYKAFPTREAAIEAFRGPYEAQTDILRAIAAHRNEKVNYDAFPQIVQDALAVDAACSKNPGPVEYRGVWVRTGQQIFHVGPLDDGTNNLGEFLALVHGLALLTAQGRTNVPIYTDSKTARSWVRNRKIKTTVQRTPRNAEIFRLIDRALGWLATHTPTNPILTWDTPAWGEIPADFGRK